MALLKTIRCISCWKNHIYPRKKIGIPEHSLYNRSLSYKTHHSLQRTSILSPATSKQSTKNSSSESHLIHDHEQSNTLSFKPSSSWTLSTPFLNWEFLLSEQNFDEIAHNINIRKGVGNISELVKLVQQYEEKTGFSSETVIEILKTSKGINEVDEKNGAKELRQKIIQCASSIPNQTHPLTPLGEEHESQLLDLVGEKREFNFNPKGVVQIGTDLKYLRTGRVGVGTGQGSYYFLGDFARLQDALVNYTVDTLSEEGFKMVYVPELIHPSVIEGCGFKTTGKRHQVYHMWPGNGEELCLAGTGEMPLAGMLAGRVFDGQNLPEKLMTISKCYRAEVAAREIEKGIYRVHQFTKVEMFGVANEEKSEDLMQEFTAIQRKMYTQLGLHFRILNMPSSELGAPAYCKHDMETWMYERGFWGEISSTSNCTDFQSRRLGIKYQDQNGNLKFAHTVNGTACAVPRLIMAIAEHYQTPEGNIEIPEVLQPYMKKSVIERPSKFPRISPHRQLSHHKK